MKHYFYGIALIAVSIWGVEGYNSKRSLMKELISSNIEALTYDYEWQYENGHKIVVAEMGRRATEEEKEKSRYGIFNYTLTQYHTKSDPYWTRPFYNMGTQQWDNVHKCEIYSYYYGFGNGYYCFAKKGNLGYYW